MNRPCPNNLENVWRIDSPAIISRETSGSENSRILLSSRRLGHEYFSEIHVGDVSGHVESHSNSGSSGVNESLRGAWNIRRVSHFATLLQRRRGCSRRAAAGWSPRAKIGTRVDACAFCRGCEPENFASRRASSFAGFMLMPRTVLRVGVRARASEFSRRRPTNLHEFRSRWKWIVKTFSLSLSLSFGVNLGEISRTALELSSRVLAVYYPALSPSRYEPIRRWGCARLP